MHTEYDFEMADSTDDPNLEWAVNEYESHLDPESRARFVAFRESGYDLAARAISDMAMLIAAAKTLVDDDEFERAAEHCFEECLLDCSEIRALRNFYFRSVDQINFPPEMAVVPLTVVDQRIDRWIRNYRML